MNSRLPPPPPSPKPSSDLAALTARPFGTMPVPSVNQAEIRPLANPEMAATELTDLADDDVEVWAMGGTKILDQPRATPAPPPAAPIHPVALEATLAAGSPVSQSFAPPPVGYSQSFSPPPAYPQSHSYPPVAMQQSVPPVASHKRSNLAVWLAAASLVGVFGLVFVAAIGYWFYHSSQQQAEAALDESLTHQVSNQAPNQAMGTQVQSDTANPNGAQNDPKIPAKNDSATTRASNTNSIAAHPATPATTSVKTTTTAPTPQPVVTAKPVAAPKGDGTLQTFAAGKGQPIVVDGTQVGVGGTSVKVACGMHQIAVGSGKAKIVNVPCDGTITVGSPDGT